MQASVHTYDLGERAGTVLLDTGKVLPFAPEAFAASGLRHLRLGQRVSIEVSADPESEGTVVTRLWIVGVGPGQPVR